MIASERHRKIVTRIGHSGSARVSDLARLFDVAEETIRRDLRRLSEQGRLVRTHGGAMATDPHAPGGPEMAGVSVSHIDLPFEQRDAAQLPQKQAIAAAACKLVKPGEVIALDASSTVCELARRLPDIPLTVVTNSLAVCSILSRRSRITAVCTGGVLDAEAMAFVGLQAERTLEAFNIARFFFSCRGIDLDRGISEANDRQAAVKLRMIEASRRRTLLVDTSKLGLASTVFYAPADIADHIIIDRPCNASSRDAVDAMVKRGLQIDEVDLIQDA